MDRIVEALPPVPVPPDPNRSEHRRRSWLAGLKTVGVIMAAGGAVSFILFQLFLDAPWQRTLIASLGMALIYAVFGGLLVVSIWSGSLEGERWREAVDAKYAELTAERQSQPWRLLGVEETEGTVTVDLCRTSREQYRLVLPNGRVAFRAGRDSNHVLFGDVAYRRPSASSLGGEAVYQGEVTIEYMTGVKPPLKDDYWPDDPA